MDPADSIVVHFDRRSLRGMTLAGLPTGAAGLLLLVYAPEVAREMGESALAVRAIGLLCALFFGGWGVIAARSVLDFGPALVIDAQGIE